MFSPASILMPNRPILMAYGLTQSRICASWKGVTGATQYRVFNDGALTTTTSNLGCSITGLSPGTSATIEVLADTPSGTFNVGKSTATTLSGSLIIQDTMEFISPDSSASIQGWTALNPTIQVTNRRKRGGKKSVEFYYPYEQALLYDAYHCELDGNNLLHATLGSEYWFGLGTFLDSSYEVIDDVNNGEIIWQWHGSTGGPATGGSPPLALYVHGTVAAIEINIGDYPNTHAVVLYEYDVRNDIGVWTDWVGHVVFDYTNGLVDMWKGNQKIVTYRGPTIYHANGQVNENGPYILIGPYKWNWTSLELIVQSRTMYADQIRIADDTGTFSTVDPAQ